MKLCIYRTNNGCGWGVKTLEKIKRGQFVVEYVGEVITSEEAEERGKVYDAEGRTYLFDLDYNLGPDNPYTVDAAEFGNVSHFINHSCDPNLSIFNVWIDCLDPNLPRWGKTSIYYASVQFNTVFVPGSACSPAATSPRGSRSPSTTAGRRSTRSVI